MFDLIDSPPVADLDIHFQGVTHRGSTADQAPNEWVYQVFLDRVETLQPHWLYHSSSYIQSRVDKTGS